MDDSGLKAVRALQRQADVTKRLMANANIGATWLAEAERTNKLMTSLQLNLAYDPMLDALKVAGLGDVRLFTQSDAGRELEQLVETVGLSALRIGGMSGLNDALAELDFSPLTKLTVDELTSAVSNAQRFVDAVMRTPVSAAFTVDALRAPDEKEAAAPAVTSVELLNRLERIESLIKAESVGRTQDSDLQLQIAFLLFFISVLIDEAPELWTFGGLSLVIALQVVLARYRSRQSRV